MMGFGGMGMTLPWLFGGITVAAIWACVFWILASLGGAHARTQSPTPAPPPPQLTPEPWQQPTFTTDGANAAEPDPEPAAVRGESATR